MCLIVSVDQSVCIWMTFDEYFDNFAKYTISTANIIKGVCLKGFQKDPNGLCRPEY